ncbi:MAG: hypothetical protein WD038_02740 [Balneolales bacterium]
MTILKMQDDQDLEKLFDDAAYLQDELTALKLVISAVPHSEKPLGQESIKEMIILIDHAQTTYYSPVISRIFSEAKPVLNDIDNFNTTFSPLSEENDLKPDEIINMTIKNRTALLDKLKQMPEEDLQRTALLKGNETSIAELLNEMIGFERNKLKEIAERVLIIDAGRSAPKPPQT